MADQRPRKSVTLNRSQYEGDGDDVDEIGGADQVGGGARRYQVRTMPDGTMHRVIYACIYVSVYLCMHACMWARRYEVQEMPDETKKPRPRSS